MDVRKEVESHILVRYGENYLIDSKGKKIPPERIKSLIKERRKAKDKTR